ncbi:exosortase A [Sphingomonas cavernae]|uniref:Exosortase A n=1 Tax=Sphingomonas cavernae TaxID=2320861 RepID=A0A418WN41_9SPHN|nr:exosortase A [Sphingomonas cavernae]RJF91420.1 exosortase A [Sphingomonas cavernae]
MTITTPITIDDATPVSESWRRQGLLTAVAIVLILALFARDTVDIASIWWNSSTFGHCLLIPPILAWLVWQRWPDLLALVPCGWAWGLVPVAGGALGWLLGDAAGVALARHLGLVLMLQGAVIALLGPKVARALAFPIFYMIFMVPFGEELVPPLQTITAKMCMVLLDLVGIPARIEGVFITTPNGYFEVAEACSGVNFLIAMIAYGALAANLCFMNWRRRLPFMLLCVLVPILANGIRAWGTIYISELTSISFAESFDHVVYGWVFFAIVMAIVMGISWPLFDRSNDTCWFDSERLIEPMREQRYPYALPAAVVAMVAAPLLWSAAIAATGRTSMPSGISLPEVAGWQRVQLSTRYPWFPHFVGADHRLIGRYRNAAGDEVDLAILLFAYQEEGKELVGYGQGAVDPASDWAWTATAVAPSGGIAERIVAPGPVTREVVSFYRVGGTLTGSATRVKLETLKSRLIGGDQAGVAVLVSAEEGVARSARPAIDAFLTSLGPVDRFADDIAASARGG